MACSTPLRDRGATAAHRSRPGFRKEEAGVPGPPRCFQGTAGRSPENMQKCVDRFIPWLVRTSQVGLACYLVTIADIFQLNDFTCAQQEDTFLLPVTMSQASARLSPWCSGGQRQSPASCLALLLQRQDCLWGVPSTSAAAPQSACVLEDTVGPTGPPPSSGN